MTNYDSKCWDLADAFLGDEPHLHTTDLIEKLAATIQDAIEVAVPFAEKAVAFRGAPLGLTPAHPTMALDGSEIRLPFLCEGEEPEGALIGFVGRQVP